MAVSSTMFRSEFAQRKFMVLLDRLHVESTLALVNTNVEQLSFFLSYYNDMRLQWQAQRTNTVGMVLGAIVLFMAISSFLADTLSVVERFGDVQSRLFVVIVIGVIGLSILGVMIWRARRVLHWRPRPQMARRRVDIHGRPPSQEER